MNRNFPIVVLVIILARFVDTAGQTNTTNAISGSAIFSPSFLTAGSRQTIVYFVIDNNYEDAFDVTFTFGNSGTVTRAGGTQTIPFTEIILQGGGGTLGEGLTPPDNIDILSNMTAGSYTWDPGLSQTTATEGYVLKILVSWDANPESLAGVYTEQISAVITPRL